MMGILFLGSSLTRHKIHSIFYRAKPVSGMEPHPIPLAHCGVPPGVPRARSPALSAPRAPLLIPKEESKKRTSL